MNAWKRGFIFEIITEFSWSSMLNFGGGLRFGSHLSEDTLLQVSPKRKKTSFFTIISFSSFSNFFCKPSFFFRRWPSALPFFWHGFCLSCQLHIRVKLASKPQLPTFDWPSHPDTTGAASWAPRAAGSGAALRPRRLGRAHQWGRSVGCLAWPRWGHISKPRKIKGGQTVYLSLITWWISVKFQEISCFVFVRLCKSPNFGILIVARICKVKNS